MSKNVEKQSFTATPSNVQQTIVVVLSQNPSWSVVGNGPTAHHTWRHCSPRAGSPGLGAAQTHSAAGRVQPHRQENRQCDAAAGSLQVHLNHVEEPVTVWK